MAGLAQGLAKVPVRDQVVLVAAAEALAAAKGTAKGTAKGMVMAGVMVLAVLAVLAGAALHHHHLGTLPTQALCVFHRRLHGRRHQSMSL